MKARLLDAFFMLAMVSLFCAGALLLTGCTAARYLIQCSVTDRSSLGCE